MDSKATYLLGSEQGSKRESTVNDVTQELGPTRDGEASRVAGRPRLLRSINEQNVLRAIRSAGRMSRRELTEASDLSKPTVGLVLDRLTADGLVRVSGQRTGSPGPRASLYEIRPEAGFALSLDVGFEYVRGAIADISGTVRVRGSRTVHAASTRSRTADLVALAGSLTAEAGIAAADVTQTVVGCPGVHNGQATDARARSQWRRPAGGAPAVSVAEIAKAFGATATIENDVNLAALAEHHHGHGRQIDNFAFITIGTGVGMGVVLNNELHTGAHGAAGEIGFMPMRTSHLDSGEVHEDSLETRASAGGVVRAARRLGMRGRLTARSVFESAARGDERAVAAVQAEVHDVAEAVAAIATVLDPSLVVFGGGVGRAAGFAEAVRAQLVRLLPVPPEVRVSAFGDEAVVEGGLVAGVELAWDRLLGAR
jgi:predicted NBD/HSP70 family sugar kinase